MKKKKTASKVFGLFSLMLSLVWTSAWAETYVYSSDQAPTVYFECEDFDSEIPAALSGVFDGCLQAGDEILCGTRRMSRYYSERETGNGTDALLAVRREEKILLLGAEKRDGVWRSAVETEDFFFPGQKFDVTVLPHHNAEGAFIGTFPALVCGEEEFLVSVREGGNILLEYYRAPWPDGSTLGINVGMGWLYADRYKDGILQESRSAAGVFSMRLRGWRYETFPKSCAEVAAWADKGMPEFAEDEAFIFGVNLREKPTSQSRSLGQYRAKVRVLDRAEGVQVPWYQVQLEDKTGWVSGTYVLWPENERHRAEIMMHLSQMLYE